VETGLVDVNVIGSWTLAVDWLERLLSAVKHHSPVPELDLAIRNDPSAQYVLLVEKGPPVRLNINLAKRWAVEELFKGDYLDAAVRHEFMHMRGKITFLHNALMAPRAIADVFGEALWQRASELLTEAFVLALNEVYAVAITPPSDASKYLDYELWKFVRSWSEVGRRGAVKANWLLQAALLESFCRSLGKAVPDGLSIILSVFKRDMHDEAILAQAEKLFRGLWNAVKAAEPIKDTDEKQFDVVAESFQLAQLLTIQKNVFFNVAE